MLTTRWRIEMFGGLRARQGDQSVERFRRGKEAALLAYLAFYSKQSHGREQLADRFWPEADADAGRASLRVALTSLRRRLEPPGTPQGSVLVADRTTVRLNPATFVTDVAEFEAALQAARLQEAVSLYAGELLPGYLDEWAGPERGRLSLLFVEALNALAQALGEAGDTVSATDFALRTVAAPPRTAGREAVIAYSRARYTKGREEVEREIAQRMGWAPPDFAGEDPAAVEGKQRAYQAMTNVGMPKEQALDLLARFDLGAVESQIAWLPSRHAKQPARFLAAAIEGDYDKPLALRGQTGRAENNAPPENDAPPENKAEGSAQQSPKQQGSETGDVSAL